jgi:adenylosuccinate synthase
MEVKVVTGSNFGDEGKGLVSGCLAREAAEKGNKTLTIFFNGTSQRAHSFEDVTRHFMAAGENYGSDTFYHRMFVVDPIMLWLSKSTPIIDPRCRVIFPCDVLYGQAREKQVKHGSCGFGLFAAVKRYEDGINCFQVADFFLPDKLFYTTIQRVDSHYNYKPNEIHNMRNFLNAIKWVKENCRIIEFENLLKEEIYDTII